MEDLTVLFLTVNRVPWMEYQNKVLLDATGSFPLITISREPMKLPGINLIQDETPSHFNIYKQMLRGAKIARTPYVAMAEDDILYHKSHFNMPRPALDTFQYNWNRWSLFTFGEPTYSFKTRYCNGVSILPRLELIDALEERFSKWNEIPHELNGELGYEKVEKRLGVKVRKSEFVYSKIPVVQIHHTLGTSGASRPGGTLDLEERKKRKRMGFIRAYDIPYWGKSDELIKHFK